MGCSAGSPIETSGTTTNLGTGAAVYLATNGLDESYSYNAFSNLQQSGYYSFVQAYTAANQLSGWNHDPSGDLLRTCLETKSGTKCCICGGCTRH